MATLEMLLAFESIKRSFAVTAVYLRWGGARAGVIQVAFSGVVFLVVEVVVGGGANKSAEFRNGRRNKIWGQFARG